MKYLITILCFLAFNSYAQSVTNQNSHVAYPLNYTPCAIIDLKTGDTVSWYWNEQEVKDWVAAHGGSGFGPATLTDDVTVDGAGNSVYWTNMPNFIVGYNNAGQFDVFNSSDDNTADASVQNATSEGTASNLESYSDNVGGSFTHYLLTVGGQTAVLIDSGADFASYGADGITKGIWDGIAQTYTVNAAGGMFVPNNGVFTADNTGTFRSGLISTQSYDGNTQVSIQTGTDGSYDGLYFVNALSSFAETLDPTGTTVNMPFPSYANDAAAGIGGLITGSIYQITGTGVVTVKQ